MIKQTAAVLLALSLSACAISPFGSSDIPRDRQTLQRSADAAAASVRQPEMRTIAYFDRQGEVVSEPVAGGYYRVLLGRNGKGQAVVQDFYQDSQTKQVNAVVIPDDDKLTSFDAADGQGRTVWYSPQGRLLSFSDIEHGRTRRQGIYVDERLRFSIDSPDDSRQRMTAYDENGRPLVLLQRTEQAESYTIFDEQGRKIAQADAKQGFPADAAANERIKAALSEFFRLAAEPTEAEAEEPAE